MAEKKRVPKTEKTLIDPLKPVKDAKFNISDDDCFGRLWDPKTKECSMCADETLCSIVYQDNLKKQVKKIEEQEHKFLDQVKTIEPSYLDILEQEIKQRDLDDSPMTSQELVLKLMENSNIKDERAGIEKTREFIQSRPVFLHNKKIYHKLNDKHNKKVD